jgi:hypothetical protein
MKEMRRIHEAEMVQAGESTKSSVKAFVRGLFVGGALGAGTMFLFVPKSGRKSSRAY